MVGGGWREGWKEDYQMGMRKWDQMRKSKETSECTRKI